jgi:hypothetical protein
VASIAKVLRLSGAPRFNSSGRVWHDYGATTAPKRALLRSTSAAEEKKYRNNRNGDYCDEFRTEAVHMPNE